MNGGVYTIFNRRARNNDDCERTNAENMGLFPNRGVSLGVKKSDPFILHKKTLRQAHAYLLGNCDDIQEYIRYIYLNIVLFLYN